MVPFRFPSLQQGFSCSRPASQPETAALPLTTRAPRGEDAILGLQEEAFVGGALEAPILWGDHHC